MEEGGGGRDHDGGSSAGDAGRVTQRCTAIVPAWRAEDTLLATLQSLLSENADSVERVIVVGCATDRCLDIARRCTGVDVIALPRRASAGRARSVGRQKAGASELLLFVDADCVLAPGAARRLIEGLRAGDLAAAGASIAQQGDGVIGWLRHLLEFKEAVPGVPGHSPRFLPSTVLLVRACVFDACGGFPDMWPGEDLVFSRRMTGLGVRFEKVGAAVAWHTHPQGFREYLAHERRLGSTAARARLIVGGSGTAFVGRVWLSPVLLCARTVRAAVWLIRFRPREIPRFVALFPLYFLGLAAWTTGFAGARRSGAPT